MNSITHTNPNSIRATKINNRSASGNMIEFNEFKKTDKCCSINERVLKNKWFAIKHTNLVYTEDKVYYQSLTSNTVSFLFFVKGSARICQHTTDVNISQSENFIQRIATNNQDRSVFIAANKDYEIVDLLVDKSFLNDLLDRESWTSKMIAICSLFSGPKEGKEINPTIHFDYRIHRILLDMLDAHLLDANHHEYVSIKIKEIILILNMQLSHSKEKIEEEMECIIRFLDTNIHGNYTLEEIAAHFNFSSSKLKIRFKEYTGYTLHEFFIKLKMNQAVLHLKSNLNCNEIASSIGYASVSHFIKVFKKHYGYTPKEYATIY